MYNGYEASKQNDACILTTIATDAIEGRGGGGIISFSEDTPRVCSSSAWDFNPVLLAPTLQSL
jgi:hypothetical protein